MEYKIGITGQSGFIGSHLIRHFEHDKKNFFVIPFKDEYFDNENKLDEWVLKCNIIIHLAALSRHPTPLKVLDTNISLVNRLIRSLNNTKSKAHIIFSSSIQENVESEYGKSKKEGRKMLAQWCKINQVIFTGLILPNVFGPYARPHYASVVATFSYQLMHNEIPRIISDSCLNLIHINDLIKIIEKSIVNQINCEEYYVPFTDQITVSEILNLLEYFKKCMLKNETAVFRNAFEKNLFETFISYK